MALDEAGVESAGILGMKQCFLQFCIRAQKQSTIDPDHPILPALLNDLAVNADTLEEPLGAHSYISKPSLVNRKRCSTRPRCRVSSITHLMFRKLRGPISKEIHSLDQTSSVVSTQLTRFLVPTNVLISSA